MERIGVSKIERFIVNRYIKRFLLKFINFEILRMSGKRILYLIASNRSGYTYRIRFDKVKGMQRPTGMQIINKLEVFLIQAETVHGDKYDYSLVTEEDLAYEHKFPVICNKEGHGTFYTHRSRHIQQRKGCPVCGIERRRKKNKF